MLIPRFLPVLSALLLSGSLAVAQQPIDLLAKHSDPEFHVAACDKLFRRGDGDLSHFVKYGPIHAAAWQWEALKGDLQAQWLWARCLVEGIGTRADTRKALEWFRKAADQGCGLAMNEIAEIYLLGTSRDVQQDPATGFAWAKKAADARYPLGYRNLGICYLRGAGTARNLELARKHLEKTAALGYASGHLFLGHMAEQGIGGPRDLALAAKLYREAADLGDVAGTKALERLARGGASTATPNAAGLIAYAGTWSARFTEFGRTEKRSYFFTQDGLPMWRGTVMKQPGQVLARDGLDRATLLRLSGSPQQLEYTLNFFFSVTDANRVERFVFRPVPGRPDQLHFEHWEQLRTGQVLRFRTTLRKE